MSPTNFLSLRLPAWLRSAFKPTRSLDIDKYLKDNLFEAVGAGFWEWDASRDEIRLSPISARMHGLEISVDAVSGPITVSVERWKACIVPEDFSVIGAEVKATEPTDLTNSVEFRTIDPRTGAYRWIHSLGRAFRDDRTGKIVRRAGLHIDVTVRRQAEEASRHSQIRMRLSEERLALALDSGVEGIWDWDIVEGRIWISHQWLARLGYAVDDVAARQPMDHIIHSDDRDRLTAVMIEHIKGHTPTYECEHRVVCSDKTSFWVLTRGRVVERDAAGRAMRTVGTQIDITHRRESEARVEYLALHDDLTGLPNRRLFRQRLNQAIEGAQHGRHSAAVLACDLDGFSRLRIAHDASPNST